MKFLGYQSPYKPCSHNPYIGIIISLHVDTTQSTGHGQLQEKNELKEKQYSEGTH